MILPAIFPFITGVVLALLGFFVLAKNRKAEMNLSFFLLCFAASVWLLFYAMAYYENDLQRSLLLFRIGYLGVLLIAIATLHFSSSFLGLYRMRFVIGFCYSIGLLIAFFILATDFIIAGTHRYDWGLYPRAGKFHLLFLAFFMSLVSAALTGLGYYYFFKSKNLTRIRQQQLKYVLLAISIFTMASIDFLPNYGISLYPFGFLPTTAFIVIISYSIVRYRLVEISLAITRTGIFVVTYSFVLLIPFALAFGWQEQLRMFLGESWWMVPLVTSTVLATIGPFIYLYIQKRAEDRLFQEQRRYQSTLRQASTGMGKIKDLNRLVTLIVHIMTRTVRVDYSMVFLNDQNAKEYKLAAFRSRQVRPKFRSNIGHDTAVVKTLLETQNPIVYDEIKQRTQDYGDLKLARLEAELKAMDAALVVPSFVDEKLLAILVMGNKLSGKIYSSDDLAVFSILANQSALAIENAQFYEDMKKTTEQLLKAEKMATIGTLADGLSHQINNRLHALGFIAGDALDTLKRRHNLAMSLEVKDMMLDLEHALNRIESNVMQGGEIVQGLLKYTRKGEEGKKPVELNKLIEAALEMTQFKIKPGEMVIKHEYPNDLPKIHGNFTQLQEVFFNLIDNAYDAMMQRKTEFKEPGYVATIRISAKDIGEGELEILVEDNGVGIRDEDKEKIFTPFFTTKLSSRKGTGLGLYVIQRLIEENHGGKVYYESKFKEGTKVHLTLPITAGTTA